MSDVLTDEVADFLTRYNRPDLADHVRGLAAKTNRGRQEAPERQENSVDLHLEMRAAIAAGELQKAVLKRFYSDDRAAHVEPEKRNRYLFNVLKLRGRADLRERVNERMSVDYR